MIAPVSKTGIPQGIVGSNPTLSAMDVDKCYSDWIKLIAESNDSDELVTHFREHVGDHFHHHDNEGEFGFKIWLTGVVNFLRVFEQKFTEIEKAELLFQLCVFYKEKGKGPKPSFDIDVFMENFDSKIKDYYLKRKSANRD